MAFAHEIQPIEAGDEELRALLEEAQLPSLLVALAHATGDASLLDDELVPDCRFVAGPQGGYDEARIARAKDICHAALIRLRDVGSTARAKPDDALLRRMLGFLVGPDQLDEVMPLLLGELGLDGEDARAPRWKKDELAPDRAFEVAIIGAGMSGLAASLRLAEAGIEHVVLEKNADVGGTWLENTYPGCRVDVPNHFYSYSFAQKDDWPQLYSTQDVLLDYFRECADTFDLRARIEFETEVTEAVWSDERARWTLSLRGADGRMRSIEADAVISAVGQLNRPLMPEIEGRDEFAGPAFHSARWDWSVPLAGKRVAVIGTGASAAQFVPPLADEASELFVFQRTAPWLLPTPDYHDPVPEGLGWLFAHVPFYSRWYRFWLFWSMTEGLLDAVRVEEGWPHPERSVSTANDGLRELLTGYLRECCGGDEALFAKMLPDYPPCSKRFVRDNGLWPATMARADVTLETTGIERISEKGVVLEDGREIEVDAIVYGTGFTASDFLMPMKVTGRGGRDLHETWHGDARAYLGITVPHFPNLFMTYGPNTNIVVNGSIIFFSECEIDYIVGCLEMLLRGGYGGLDCKTSVHDAYNAEIDDRNQHMAWGAASVNSWYKNRYGRVSQNWPSTLVEYWQRTREPRAADYELLQRPHPAASRSTGDLE
jgi:4-hydroxyacetophenone monooxygenase